MNGKKIYLASPLGFSEAGRKFYYEQLIPLLVKKGLKVVDPWLLTPESEIKRIIQMEYGPEKKAAWKEMNIRMAETNRSAIDSAEGMLAVLDGVDVDSGTASEIGYAFGIGKVIIGYRGDFRLSADNEGSRVNLQVEYFITKSGGDIATSLENLDKMLELFDN